MEKNIFELAARGALRFESTKGHVNTEDLFRLSLTDLDTVAKNINRKIKEFEEESFVSAKSATLDLLNIKLDIVKFVIADRLKANQDRQAAAEKAAQKQKVLEILERKQNSQLEELSVEELKAMLQD